MNCTNIMLHYQIALKSRRQIYNENHNILSAWPVNSIICENDCDNIMSGALWQNPPRCRLNTTEWTGHQNIYEGARGARRCAGPEKNKSERDLKFTWGINVKEHSRLSESYDLCKVYSGTMSLLKGTFKDSEVNRPVSSLEGAHPSPSPRMAQTLPQVLTSSCHFPPNFFSSFNF